MNNRQKLLKEVTDQISEYEKNIISVRAKGAKGANDKSKYYVENELPSLVKIYTSLKELQKELSTEKTLVKSPKELADIKSEVIKLNKKYEEVSIVAGFIRDANQSPKKAEKKPGFFERMLASANVTYLEDRSSKFKNIVYLFKSEPAAKEPFKERTDTKLAEEYLNTFATKNISESIDNDMATQLNIAPEDEDSNEALTSFQEEIENEKSMRAMEKQAIAELSNPTKLKQNIQEEIKREGTKRAMEEKAIAEVKKLTKKLSENKNVKPGVFARITAGVTGFFGKKASENASKDELEAKLESLMNKLKSEKSSPLYKKLVEIKGQLDELKKPARKDEMQPTIDTFIINKNNLLHESMDPNKSHTNDLQDLNTLLLTKTKELLRAFPAAPAPATLTDKLGGLIRAGSTTAGALKESKKGVAAIDTQTPAPLIMSQNSAPAPAPAAAAAAAAAAAMPRRPGK